MRHIQIENLTVEELKEIIAQEVKNNIPQPQEKKTPNYLTREQVANLLNVTFPTLNRWAKQGILPTYRIGNRVLYKSDEVHTCIQEIPNIKYQRK